MTERLIACMLAPLLAGIARAAVYSDQGQYLASSVSVGLVADFEGITTYYGFATPGTPYQAAPRLTISSNNDLLILGGGQLGGGSDGITTGGWDDLMTLTFAEGTDSVGFDYFLGSRWSTGPLSIRVFGAADTLLYDSGALAAPVRVMPNTGDPASPPPAFFGIDGVGKILRVEIGGSGVASAGVDNIHTTVPEPSTLAYGGLLLAGAVLRRRRKP